jgi:hypothetical protein
MEKIQKETEDLTNRLRAQQAAEAEANRQRYAKEREMLIRKGPQKYNADPLHLMCEGSYNGGKRFDLDIIPREAKAVITNPDGTSSELPLYNLVMGYRRAVTPYGNVVPEHFIQAANINFNIYNDDGWPRIRYYEEGKGAEGQYSCNYYRQPLGG